MNTEIPAANEPEDPQAEREFVMGPRQLASVAFVAILVSGTIFGVAYFAGRKNTEPPRVTERVIERVIQAPAAAVVAEPEPAEVPEAPEKAPKPVAVVALAPKQVEAIPFNPSAAPGTGNAEVTAPILNRVYLQAGSVEVGVAQVMVEGLRQRGIPAIVGIGINRNVARVLVGPFDSADEQQAAKKKVEELGFHPYPRFFTAKDLEQQPSSPVESPIAQAPAKP